MGKDIVMSKTINNLLEGIYASGKLAEMGIDHECPYCHSTKVLLRITGTVKQFKCKQCKRFFSLTNEISNSE
jgi:transposase-like protein